MKDISEMCMYDVGKFICGREGGIRVAAVLGEDISLGYAVIQFKEFCGLDGCLKSYRFEIVDDNIQYREVSGCLI